MQMTSIFLRVIILGLVGGSFAVAANMIALMIIGQINQNLPQEERISYVWWGTGIRKLHHQFYPKSRLVLLMDLCGICMVICFAAVIWIQAFAGPR